MNFFKYRFFRNDPIVLPSIICGGCFCILEIMIDVIFDVLIVVSLVMVFDVLNLSYQVVLVICTFLFCFYLFLFNFVVFFSLFFCVFQFLCYFFSKIVFFFKIRSFFCFFLFFALNDFIQLLKLVLKLLLLLLIN